MRKAARSFLVQTLLVFVACFQYAGALGAEANKAIHLKVGYASITGNRIPLGDPGPGVFRAQRSGRGTDLYRQFLSRHARTARRPNSIYSGSPKPRLKPLPQARIWSLPAASRRSKLIVQPGIKSAADLKGKKVGIDGSVGRVITRRMLEKLGLKPDDVEYMHVVGGGNQRVAAFRSGILSAVASVERFERAGIPYNAGRRHRNGHQNHRQFLHYNPHLSRSKPRHGAAFYHGVARGDSVGQESEKPDGGSWNC